MKISGFTFVKNAVKFDYPIIESIKSMLPIVDELIINIGLPDDDGTLSLIKKNIKSSKLKIIKTEWNPKFTYKSRILSQQTNIALYQCKGDWCIYLQADEVIHEKDYDKILYAMKKNLNTPEVEGLLFDYIHFFGSYKTYVNSYHWYQKEIRIIRNFKGITSWKDAQSFRLDGKKLKVKETGANIFHYGWVRPPEIMIRKKQYHDSLHHGNKIFTTDKKKYDIFFEFVNQLDPFMISYFTDTHPKVMKKRINSWKYEFDKTKSRHKLSKRDIRYRLSDIFYKITGLKIGEYKNYKLIK